MRAATMFLAVTVVLSSSAVALAHGDHEPQRPRPVVSEETAKELAKESVKRLVADKKVPESWTAIAVKRIEKRTYEKGDWEWLVTFENPKLKENKVLYVFLASTGEFSGANFTGK